MILGTMVKRNRKWVEVCGTTERMLLYLTVNGNDVRVRF